MNKGIMMAFIAVFLWGLTIPPTKWAMEDVHPFTLTFIRLFLASIFFVPFTWSRVKPSTLEQSIPWKRLFSISFTGVSGFFIFNYSGIALTSGLDASILNATLSLFTLLIAAIFLKEKVNLSQWIGLSIGLVGVVLISIQTGAQAKSSLWGDLLILLSNICWAIYTAQTKSPKKEAHLPSNFVTALSLMLGGITMLPFVVMEIVLYGWPVLSQKTVFSILFLTFGPTIISYALWNKSLQWFSAGSAGMYLNAIPLISVAASALLLDESFTWRTIVGGTMILFGVIWADLKKKKSQKEALASTPALASFDK
jgi:drug/metabolite transporter (DMT)-like permease